MTGPSARLEAKVRNVRLAGKNRPMAMKIGKPRQTTGSPARIKRRSEQEQQREGGHADRSSRQRLDGPQPQLGGDHAGAEEGRGSKGEQDGCGHAIRLERASILHLWTAVGILPIQSRRSSTPRGLHGGRNKDKDMATHKLLLLPGDGIGPEVMAEVKRLIDWINAAGIAHFETEQGLVGGSAYDAHKVSI